MDVDVDVDVDVDKTRQDKTRQDKTRQDKTRQDKTRQDKTRQDKTRQDNNSTESKVTRVAFNSYKKVPTASGDQQLSARHGTLQCSAGPEWYGCHGTIDTLTSIWAPAVGRPSESAGCSQHAKKTRQKTRSTICMMSVQAVYRQ